ncbi:metallophosphoesterase [Pseudomonas typographi]|uniref:metallophosphoesterase n=1 Tax=Pseudomonas typographi TaxID=2715964 RepID=UPI00168967A0|nr:serine/threonine protein phosphatase [Pseudomonas typographi]
MNVFARFPINTAGRDFAVGDIHGHFTRLEAVLSTAGFDPKVDRLFSVGDLVDRGPESIDVMRWLNRSWFHPVRGNHEQMAIETARQALDSGMYLHNGGAWFLALNRDEQQEYAAQFADLALAIEVETPSGLVGLVHADCPYGDWNDFRASLANGPASERDHIQAVAQWSRSRIDSQTARTVPGVRAVVVGHTPVRQPVVLGNVYHIDTGGWLTDGHFTLLDLHTLETIPPTPAKLAWEDA